jgi:hypothetical protein
MKKVINHYWTLEAEPNEDRPGMNVYLVHFSGDIASLACAENEGETADGRHVPAQIIKYAYEWIEDENIDY